MNRYQENQKYLDQLDETVPLNALEIWSAGLRFHCLVIIFVIFIIMHLQLSGDSAKHILTGQRLRRLLPEIRDHLLSFRGSQTNQFLCLKGENYYCGSARNHGMQSKFRLERNSLLGRLVAWLPHFLIVISSIIKTAK